MWKFNASLSAGPAHEFSVAGVAVPAYASTVQEVWSMDLVQLGQQAGCRAQPTPAQAAPAATAEQSMLAGQCGGRRLNLSAIQCAPFPAVGPPVFAGQDIPDCFLVFRTDSAGLDPHVQLLTSHLHRAPLPAPRAAVVGVAAAGPGVFNVTVSAHDRVALFVWLETPLAGRFSDNAFHLTGPAPVTVQFLAWDPAASVDTLNRSLALWAYANSP